MNAHVYMLKSLAIFSVLLALSSCNQQEFYEKEFLEGVGVPDEEVAPEATPEGGQTETPDTNEDDPTDGIITTPGGSGTDPDDGGSNGGTDPDDGGNNGGGTDPDDGGNNGGGTDPDDGGNNGGGTDPDDGGNAGTDPDPGVCGDGTLTNASDEFVQNTAEHAKVDILWVMDNSGSMSDEQQALAYNFNAFISNFIEKDIDFQMAITTTDARSYYSGKMVGNSDKLTAQAAKDDEAQFMEDFRNMIKVGTRGSGHEMGLETSKDFFDRYRSWAREEAYLIVVYISDEEDSSPDQVNDYIRNLQSLKTSAGMVKAYSIVTQSHNPNRQWETVGSRYMQVSEATGGEIADIHQDFYQTLSGFGFKILDLLDSFPLSGVPVDAEIRVTVNDVTLDQGWTYDDSSRSIKFDENAIPDEGEIIIAYYQKCVMSN